MGENSFAPVPTALYGFDGFDGFVLLMAAIAYWVLRYAIIASHMTRCLREQLEATSREKYRPSCMSWQFLQRFSAGGFVAAPMLWLHPRGSFPIVGSSGYWETPGWLYDPEIVGNAAHMSSFPFHPELSAA
ncbi:MAG: hypothetical protein ACYDDO_11470 [Acidiferrobacterales bacterium]